MKLKITVHGVAYEVDVDVLDWGEPPPGGALPPMQRNGVIPAAIPSAAAPPATAVAAPAPAARSATNGGDTNGRAVVSPIAGIVVEIKVAVGDEVAKGDTVAVLEAMKMNTPIAAERAGKVKKVAVEKGANVREGQVLVEIE